VIHGWPDFAVLGKEVNANLDAFTPVGGRSLLTRRGASNLFTGVQTRAPNMPRTPVDLQAATRDIRNRCARAAGNLNLIANSTEPILADPRQIILELILAQHEVEACITIMRKAWWP
jgi:hypothetical protein